MLLNLRQLEIFRAIMVAKTISGAAELLHVSQPGISRALKYIEQRLKITLFERNKGRLVATPEAEELYKELEPIYDKLEGLEWTLERITLSDKRRVRIGCSPSMVRSLVPKALSIAKRSMPDVIIRIDELSNEVLGDYICDQKGSLALSFYDPEHPLILAEKLFDSHLLCALPKEHPLTHRSSIDISDLADENMILYHPDTALGRLSMQLFKHTGVNPNPSVLVRYNIDACAMVEQNLGIALVTDFIAMKNSFLNIKILPLVQQTSLEVFILRHNEIPLSHTARTFFNHFKSALEEIGTKNLDECPPA